MRTLQKIWDLLTSEHSRVLDHLPVAGKRDYSKKLAQALKAHGKQLRSHTQVRRIEPPSRTLQELNAASQIPENVRSLTRKRD